MNNPTVSIVLPIYNGESTLEATVKSLLNQTFQDFEILACIDGSNDGSFEILSSIKDNRIKIFTNKVNMGIGRTLNKLIYKSNPHSKYIAIAEQDDYYYPYRIEKQVEFLDSNPNFGLVSGIAEFFDGNTVTSLFPGLLVNGGQYPEDPIEMFLLNYRNQIKVVNSCMMIRKDVHIENGLYFSQHFPSISVDWSYILRFSLISKIYGLPDILVRIDRRPNRNSVTKNKESQFSAARELIRSFRYEYPQIISNSDYRYAKTTQHLLELSAKGKANYLLFLAFYLGQNPFDQRYLAQFKTKLFKFFKKHWR